MPPPHPRGPAPPNICEGGKPLILGGDVSVLLPLGGDGEADWHRAFKIILYLAGLLWCFLGVSIIADIFMSAIETITSQKKRVKRGDKEVTVNVWNKTVANLTLMALGSSAPEILLSLIELVATENWNSGDLGPSTIVGSAAFNLLCIMAVCVSCLPEGEVRTIKELDVFAVTAFFSVFAYLWLLFILLGPSRDVVEVWEGVVTFLYFPLLVFIAYLADIGFFRRLRPVETRMLVLTPDSSQEELVEMRRRIRNRYGAVPESDEDMEALMHYEFAPAASRAAHRIQATRSLVGGKSVLDKWRRGQKVSKELKNSKKNIDLTEPTVEFAQPQYWVSEASRKVEVEVVRKGDLSKCSKVWYSTRDGTATADSDYKQKEGVLSFKPNVASMPIEVGIIQDQKLEPTEEFYVDLTRAEQANVGKKDSVKVVVLDSDRSGVLAFEMEKITVEASAEGTLVPILVKRSSGATGTISCKYRTASASAKAGLDFTHNEGMLVFKPNQAMATFSLEILPKSKWEGTEIFRVILDEPTGDAVFDSSTDGGAQSCILTVVIAASNSNDLSKMGIIMRKINWDEVNIGHRKWKEQFQEALFVGGSREAQQSASKQDWVLHLMSLPWKLFFALVPPTDFLGGWVCFACALIMIGIVTAIIGDMANLLGCSMNLKGEICAITFVALGTSLPDTFASMTAATQDPTADNSIGNVTGSNSVNVFLGLGLPWMMGAVYWNIQGKTKEWIDRGIKKGWGDPTNKDMYLEHVALHYNGAFVVPASSGSFGISVGTFSACAVVTIAVLMIRRVKVGGELGGPKRIAHVTSAFFVFLWFVYLSVSIATAWPIWPY